MAEFEDVLKLDYVKELLSKPLLARLGTANPKTCQPHVTPVWFAWDGKCVYISAFTSTRKVKEIYTNSRISVLIDAEIPSRVVFLEGTAEIIENPDVVARWSERIYARYVGKQEVKGEPYQSWAHDTENRIIKLQPLNVYAWQF